MLNIVRRAFNEPADGSSDPLEMFTNPGPMYLIINALAVTAITYIASFRLLNVRKAPRLLSSHGLLDIMELSKHHPTPM